MESRQRVGPPVVPEDVFVEVGLRVFSGDPAVGAVLPDLQVRDRPVRPGHHWLGVTVALGLALGAGPVIVADRGEVVVTLPPVGVQDRTLLDVVLHESTQSVGRGISDGLHPYAATSCSADLHGDDRLDGPDIQLAAALAAGFGAAEFELADLDLSGEFAALCVDPGLAKLVQHQPRGLVTREPELPL